MVGLPSSPRLRLLGSFTTPNPVPSCTQTHVRASQVSIVTGWFGRENLRWGEVDAWLLETLRDQWISGYALSADM